MPSAHVRICSLLDGELAWLGANCEHPAYSKLRLKDRHFAHLAGEPFFRGVVVIQVAAREFYEVAASGIGKEVLVQRMKLTRREILGLN